MPFFMIDDQFHLHPKVTRLLDDNGPATALAALGLWALAGSYSQARLTDGAISASDARRLLGDPRQAKRLAGLLVECELFDETDNGWSIHDFTKVHRQSGEGVKISREKRAELKRKGLLDAVALRDQNRCRYCNKVTQPPDRKSDAGRTFDHVDPNRAEGARNLVVACRGCNNKKNQRTPEEAGMTLLPVPPGPEPIRSESVPAEQIRTDTDLVDTSASASRAIGRARGQGKGQGDGPGFEGEGIAGGDLRWDAGEAAATVVAAPSGSPWHGFTGPPPSEEVMALSTCPTHGEPRPCWRCARSGDQS